MKVWKMIFPLQMGVLHVPCLIVPGCTCPKSPQVAIQWVLPCWVPSWLLHRPWRWQAIRAMPCCNWAGPSSSSPWDLLWLWLKGCWGWGKLRPVESMNDIYTWQPNIKSRIRLCSGRSWTPANLWEVSVSNHQLTIFLGWISKSSCLGDGWWALKYIQYQMVDFMDCRVTSAS